MKREWWTRKKDMERRRKRRNIKIEGGGRL